MTSPSSSSSTNKPIESNTTKHAKVVLLGEQSVGKSCIAIRFVSGQFQERSEATIGAMFLTQTVSVEKCKLKFDIWDTAGQERYRTLAPMYYRNAQAALIVYDVTRADTFLRAMSWVDELKQQTSTNILMMLVGNKCDLKNERVVLAEDAQQVAKDNGLLHIETSALTGENINQIFLIIAQDLLKHYDCCSDEKSLSLQASKSEVRDKQCKC